MLELTWENGEVSTIDFTRIVGLGGVFAPLADRNFFARVSLDASGRRVVWPGDLEFCADALYLAERVLLPAFPATTMA
jgi:hypothetical protein